ncbi:hypothetical protein MTBLM5_20232 [Magnetospirillum sp. LM-5]|uniref:hypothetical protein n=1 Tax=Magnetospirillum sp. LM-5 TaxID=2681466 RepID=UPI0013832269|nr:hypothetical protein [Magnetospirillum sp. LM-5]CAA7616804.1 hypothetical protein MTBLM5_20232 [Magnetospirillum sp. LM-5]
MQYKTPSDEPWTPADPQTLKDLAHITATAGHNACGEPPNTGITFKDACDILASLARQNESVTHIIPDNLG